MKVQDFESIWQNSKSFLNKTPHIQFSLGNIHPSVREVIWPGVYKYSCSALFEGALMLIV